VDQGRGASPRGCRYHPARRGAAASGGQRTRLPAVPRRSRGARAALPVRRVCRGRRRPALAAGGDAQAGRRCDQRRAAEQVRRLDGALVLGPRHVLRRPRGRRGHARPEADGGDGRGAHGQRRLDGRVRHGQLRRRDDVEGRVALCSGRHGDARAGRRASLASGGRGQASRAQQMPLSAPHRRSAQGRRAHQARRAAPCCEAAAVGGRGGARGQSVHRAHVRQVQWRASRPAVGVALPAEHDDPALLPAQRVPQGGGWLDQLRGGRAITQQGSRNHGPRNRVEWRAASFV